MDLLQLRYFQVVANNEHITRSAEQLNISQPAISTVISRLEQELGTPLFERSGRSIILNECGKIFLSRVNTILLEVENAKKEIQDMCSQEDNTISLSVTSPQFLQGISGYMETNPQIKWKQSVDQLADITQLLENGKIDLSITTQFFLDPDIENTLLLKDDFMVAVHPDHPLATRNSIRLSEIEGERFLALEKGRPFRTQTDQLFASMGVKPNIVMECDHYLRRELLSTNAGITVTSSSARIRHLYDPKIKFLKIEDATESRDIVLSRHKKKFLTKATQSFCDFLKSYYDSISKKLSDQV